MSEPIKQPEPLRLADALDDEFVSGRISNDTGRKASAELRRLHGEVERLRANRDFWHQACLQAQEHRDGANASNAVWEAETVKLRAEVERLRAALEYAVSQNEHDMLLTGDECRAARNALKEPK